MTARALTAVQKQILLFLGTGGPADIFTGSSITRCGERTGGRRVVDTTATTLHVLEHHRLVARDPASGTYSANREAPSVARLLERRTR